MSRIRTVLWENLPPPLSVVCVVYDRVGGKEWLWVEAGGGGSSERVQDTVYDILKESIKALF